MYCGKEGFATLAWNVHVTATCWIKYVAPMQPGASNGVCECVCVHVELFGMSFFVYMQCLLKDCLYSMLCVGYRQNHGEAGPPGASSAD